MYYMILSDTVFFLLIHYIFSFNDKYTFKVKFNVFILDKLLSKTKVSFNIIRAMDLVIS